MAGRPVNEAQREARKKEVDAAIEIIKKRRLPITRKAIAEEMGLTVQSLYGSGYLSLYINKLENAGVVGKEQGNIASLTAAEVKRLIKSVDKLQSEVKRLKRVINSQTEALSAKDEEIASLYEQLQIERGKNFFELKRDFAQRRI